MAPPSPTSREGARAAASKGERTRRRLLQRALELFGRQGYRATSVSEIARAAGISQATAYAYFSSKEELFLAVVDADATDLVREAHASIEALPVREKMRAYLVALYQGLDRHPLARRVLGGHERRVLPRMIELPALQFATELLSADMRAGQAVGEVRSDIDPDQIAVGLEAIVLSLLLAAVQSDALYVDRYVEGIYAVLAAMLDPPR
jgi:AcrR family transcriptional regulator